MSIKTASTDFPISEILRERWSPRAFSDQKVTLETLRRIFEAARWSPSASNLQPWRFIIGIKGSATYNTIFESLVDFNKLWAGTAPILMIAVAKKTNNNNEPNRYAAYDLGQAVAHMTFQAATEGLFLHQMGGFDIDVVRTHLNIPDQFDVLTVIAAGYPGNPEILHEKLKKMEVAPRERQKANDFVFTESFGKKTEIFNH